MHTIFSIAIRRRPQATKLTYMFNDGVCATIVFSQTTIVRMFEPLCMAAHNTKNKIGRDQTASRWHAHAANINDICQAPVFDRLLGNLPNASGTTSHKVALAYRKDKNRRHRRNESFETKEANEIRTTHQMDSRRSGFLVEWVSGGVDLFFWKTRRIN